MSLQARVNEIVLPGDSLDDLIKCSVESGKLIIGPGLRRYSERIIVTRPGLLRKKEPNTYYVDCHDKKYVPARGEYVLGIIISRTGESFKVDIGTSEPATLSQLAFEGATKKNRPNIGTGDVVHARLLVASPDTEPEIVCVDSRGKPAGMGVLEGGFLFNVPLHYARSLLTPANKFLKVLGETLCFEVTVAVNGRVWVKGKSNRSTLSVARAIMDAEHMSQQQISDLCSKLRNRTA